MSNTSIIILFIITATFGLILLTFVLKDKRRPMFIVAIHGIVAIASFGILTYKVAEKFDVNNAESIGIPLESYAFVFFSFALMGGAFMLIRDKVLKLGIKKWMPFIHGGLAAIGLILLIIATITK